MFGQFLNPPGLDEFPQGKAPGHGPAHFFEACLVGGEKNQVIAKNAEATALGSAPVEDTGNKLRYASTVAPMVSASCEMRTRRGRPSPASSATSQGPAGKGTSSKMAPVTEPAKIVLMRSRSFIARSGFVHILLFAPDDLSEVGLREEPERDAGTVVEVGRGGLKAFSRILDETKIERGTQDRVAQSFLGYAFQRFVGTQGCG